MKTARKQVQVSEQGSLHLGCVPTRFLNSDERALGTTVSVVRVFFPFFYC